MSQEAKFSGKQRECSSGQWLSTTQHFREQPFLQECLDSAPGNEKRAIPTLHPGGVGCGRILKRAAKEVIPCG